MVHKKKQARELQGDATLEDFDDSDVEKCRREDERGRTVLATVGKAIQNGTKIPLEWHPVYKIPCGKYKPTFSTYVGVVVRERVCITYKSWKNLPKELLDELYDVITKGFVVLKSRRNWILQQVDQRWRAFKTRLRQRWLYHKKSGRLRRRPPWKYPFISQTSWEKFVEMYSSEDFKLISQESKGRSMLKNSTYRGGRLGYMYFEEEIAKEFMKQGVHVDHVPRHLTWIRAHSRVENGVLKFDNPLDEEVANAIYALDAQAKKGEIEICGLRDDILARVLQKPEHGGRVKAVGSGITNREYFGLNTTTPPSYSRAEIRGLKSEMEMMKNHMSGMMAFMMSALNQDQLKQFISAFGNGQVGGFNGINKEFNSHMSGQGNDQLGGTNTNHSNGEVCGFNVLGKVFNGHTSGQGNDQLGGTNSHHSTEGGYFTQLLSRGFCNNDPQLVGDSIAEYNIEVEPYKVPWPDQGNDLRQPSPSHQPPPSHQPSPLRQPSPSNRPSSSQQQNQVKSTTPETDYEAHPISELEIPEGLHECRLAIEADSGIQFVAVGEVYIPGATQVVLNHFNTVQQGYRRVSITEDLVPSASLPCPTKEFSVVCQAKDSFVQWPTHLIFPKKKASKNNSSSRSPSSQGSSSRKYVITEQDRAKVTSGLLEAFKIQALGMKRSGQTIQINIPSSVFHNERCATLDYEDMLNWCFQREVGVDHISIYMRELSEICTENGISGIYGFIDPLFISPLTPTEKEEDRTKYLAHAFACNKGRNFNQLFFAPYHEGRHWILAAISPWNGTVFWLDPAGEENEIRPFAQRIINEGIKKFSLAYRKDVHKR